MNLPCDKCKHPDSRYCGDSPPKAIFLQTGVHGISERGEVAFSDCSWLGPIYQRSDGRYIYQLLVYRHKDYVSDCYDCDVRVFCPGDHREAELVNDYFLCETMTDITKPSSKKRRCGWTLLKCCHNEDMASTIVQKIAEECGWMLQKGG